MFSHANQLHNHVAVHAIPFELDALMSGFMQLLAQQVAEVQYLKNHFDVSLFDGVDGVLSGANAITNH